MKAKEVEIETARKPCLIVGEVAQPHDGSLGMADAFIDAIAGAGADAVKFQTHIAARKAPWRNHGAANLALKILRDT